MRSNISTPSAPTYQNISQEGILTIQKVLNAVSRNYYFII